MGIDRRAPGSASAAQAPGVVGGALTDAARTAAERGALEEIVAWRARAVPDAAAPLDADDLVRLLRDLLAALGLDPAIAAGVTVNTVHYYRRKEILEPPEGRTAAARYGPRHLWQLAGARLAGHLGLVSLAEAQQAMRGADERALLAFLAARVADARARAALRRPGATGGDLPAAAPAARALPGRAAIAPALPTSPPVPPAGPAAATAVLMIPLPGEAWCLVPAAHPARRSPAAARELARAVVAALCGDDADHPG
ncbi:MAG TPA: MerR family transcriptional regulator [Gemmatimonadaceae bacterium]|nr:MerR family transcriptional regulator [Gemmatimonadaceae bacterium]